MLLIPRITAHVFVGRVMPIQYLLVDNDLDYDMEYVELADWMQFREKLVSFKSLISLIISYFSNTLSGIPINVQS